MREIISEKALNEIKAHEEQKNREREETPTLSWEIPRNTKEIRLVLCTAILRQWAIPTIDFEDGTFNYDHGEKDSSFVISTYKKKYKVTIEEI